MSDEHDQLDLMDLQGGEPVCDYSLGVLTVRLRVPMSHSLKDKRHVVKSIVDAARNRFNVTAAEVGSLDNLQQAGLAFAYLSNDRRLVNSVLDKVLDFIESNPEAEVIACKLEVF